MLDVTPDLRIVDITHDIAPFDIRAGALALVRAVQYLPDGVVLAVVDPGVGTERRCIAVEVDGGFLIGPDNGLLAPSVAMLGGPQRIHALENPEYQLVAPGPTFAGRDIMAPAAAFLAAGVSIEAMGPAVDPSGLAPGLVPLPQEADDGTIGGEVLWVDHFGNCQLNIAPEQLAERGVAPGGFVGVTIGTQERRAHWVSAFAEAKPAELALVVDSYGMCMLAFDQRSAAVELKIRAGATVTMVALSERGTP
jgi:S-adenosylmethionine hydrolase